MFQQLDFKTHLCLLIPFPYAYRISSLIEHSTLESDLLVRITLALLPRIPADLLEDLVVHLASQPDDLRTAT